VRLVQQANIRPHRCAVIPFMGNSNSAGFIDTGNDLDLEHVYVSYEAVCEMAGMLGWAGPSALKQRDAQIASLQARVDQLQAEVEEADKFAEAAEYTLGKFGQKVQRKPGRPKKETETEKVA
jgi:hypothetical protein